MVPGESFNPLDRDDTGDLLQNLLAGIGLAPTWSYKNGRNYLVFTPKKKPVSQTIKMLAAVVLSVIVGFVLTLLPDSVRNGVSEHLLSPVTDLFMGLIAAVAGPLIFLSVLGSICSMGNMETLGKIEKKTILTIMTYIPILAISMTVIAALFFDVSSGSGNGSDFSQILTLLYDIVPKNLFDPFLTGNALQIIFIAVIFGVAMLTLSSKVSSVFTIVEQLGSLIQTVMSGLSSMLPVTIFVIFTNMIASGNLISLLNSWKMILLILLLIGLGLISMFLWIALKKKVSPLLLFKKALPTMMIAFTTASSAAAFATNTRDVHKEFGVDKKLADFGIPLGQVLFKPSFIPLLIVMQLTFAEANDIPITVSWLILSVITNILLSFAVPPVAGGALTGFTIAFTQLGIPLDVMGIAIALNAIIDFPATALNVSGWQLALVDAADSLGMLDKETLHRSKTGKKQ